jgi:AcrR family transcriptional regulator
MRYGIRSISMDEVARHLAMSKKTLYQHFENKDELIYKIVELDTQNDCQEWATLLEACKDKSALEETQQTGVLMRKLIAGINPIIIFELKRFHPRAWREHNTIRENQMESSIHNNILRGQAEGYYLHFLNPKIMARMRVGQVMMAFDPDIFPAHEYDFTSVQEQMFEHYVRGLLTPAGTQEWERIRKQTPTTQPLIAQSKA